MQAVVPAWNALPMEPSYWYCDTCGERIERATDGWLEWRVEEDAAKQLRMTAFRIVHHQGAGPRKDTRSGCCYPPAPPRASYTIADGHLHWYVGEDGLATLLRGLQRSSRALDVESGFEIIRRLHVPQYEEARRLWPRVAEGWDGGMPWTQELLAVVIRDGLERGTDDDE